MEDIYEILSRYFSDEGNEADKKAVERFKKSHALEYQMLARLWQRNDIEVKDFDALKAWKSMGLETKKPHETKIVKLRPAFIKLAAAVMVFLLGVAVLYYFQVYTPARQTVTMQTSHQQRGENVVLADGTKVWLNADAQISYPKAFFGKTRNLELSGEAFFQVKRDPAHPFIIKTNNTHIEVLGTSFNVQSSKNVTMVTVKSGRVNVQNAISGKEDIINAGFSAKIENDRLLKFRTTNPNYLSWKTGHFKFNNTRLQQVVRDLNTYYSKKIFIDKKRPVNCNLTAQFNQTSLQDILDIIKLTCECGVRERAESYTLYALNSDKK